MSAAGKSDEVAKAIEAQVASMSPLTEPEEGIKQAAKDFILLVPPADRTVSAWCSQGVQYGVKTLPNNCVRASTGPMNLLWGGM
jgi:hypothetical protein